MGSQWQQVLVVEQNIVEISPEFMGIWVVSFKSRVAKSLKSSRFIF